MLSPCKKTDVKLASHVGYLSLRFPWAGNIGSIIGLSDLACARQGVNNFKERGLSPADKRQTFASPAKYTRKRNLCKDKSSPSPVLG